MPRKSVKRSPSVSAPKDAPVSSVRDLFLWIAARGEEIPIEEREKIPRDLARNHEHYLYGQPRQDQV